MRFGIRSETNQGRLFIPRFRRFFRFSASTTVTEGDKFCWGEKMSGIAFVIFGHMISLYITRAIKKRKWFLFAGWGYW